MKPSHLEATALSLSRSHWQGRMFHERILRCYEHDNLRGGNIFGPVYACRFALVTSPFEIWTAAGAPKATIKLTC